MDFNYETDNASVQRKNVSVHRYVLTHFVGKARKSVRALSVSELKSA